MTFATATAGLIPILWSTGIGAEVIKRIAAPMVGGIVTSFVLDGLPCAYAVWRGRTVERPAGTERLLPAS